MGAMIFDALKDAAADTVKLIPFLFVTYLIMEALERRTSDHSAKLISSVGRFGPLVGAAVGIVPQCGFSAAAASLYSGGLISIGTLLAVFLSTSDEMLPIFISEQVELSVILRILLAKAALGAVSGLGVDFLLRFTRYKYKTEKHVRDLCDEEHCGYEKEEGSVFRSALVHTLHIILFVFVITVILTIAVEGLGEQRVAGFLTGKPVFGTFLAAAFGLIPNCASSVLITQLYLDGMLGAGQMMAGLLVGAGVGLLVLFRTNDRHPKENIKIAAMLYVIGVFWGLLIELAGITF
ncbi:MAG: arsenic efflux protein [Lachnospiraceae bacterium]|jgi:hypothetical protein